MRARTAVLSWGVVYTVLIGGLVVMGMRNGAHSEDVPLLPLPVASDVVPRLVGPAPEAVVNVTLKTSTPSKALRGLSVLLPKDGKRYDVVLTVTQSAE